MMTTLGRIQNTSSAMRTMVLWQKDGKRSLSRMIRQQTFSLVTTTGMRIRQDGSTSRLQERRRRARQVRQSTEESMASMSMAV